MQGAPHYRQHPLPPTSGSHSSNPVRFPGFPAALFPALTIALLVSAPGVDACVHTHGASMKLVDGFCSGQVGGLRYCTDCTLCSHGISRVTTSTTDVEKKNT